MPMKKTILLIAALFFCFFNSYAQPIPNGGFENWDTTHLPAYEEPIGWTSYNQDPTVPPTLTKSTSSCAGNYSARLENLTYTNQITGQLDTAVGYMVSGNNLFSYEIGFRCTVRVQSIDFCVKFTQAGNDSAELNLSFKKWHNQSGQSVQVSSQNCFRRIGNSTSFYTVSVPVTYITSLAGPASSVVPDTCIITISSSAQTGNPSITPGSTIWVDEVFISSVTGTSEDLKDESKLSVYPNPAKEEINFTSLPNGSEEIRLIDITGRQVARISVEGVNESMSLQNVSAGIYVYEIISADSKVLASGKVSVVE